MQPAAADTLAAIASKRMDALPKLELVQQLGVMPVVAQWDAALPGSVELEERSDAAERLAGLLNTLALEAIESIKRLENHVISLQARGDDVSIGASCCVGRQKCNGHSCADAVNSECTCVARNDAIAHKNAKVGYCSAGVGPAAGWQCVT